MLRDTVSHCGNGTSSVAPENGRESLNKQPISLDLPFHWIEGYRLGANEDLADTRRRDVGLSDSKAALLVGEEKGLLGGRGGNREVSRGV